MSSEDEQSVEQWARTAEFPRPPLWGQVESAILVRPVPGDLDEGLSSPGLGAKVLGVVATPVVAVLLGLLLGSSLIGLVLIYLGTTQDDPSSASGWIAGASIAYVAALTVPLSVLGIWRESRRRSPLDLVITGGTALVALTAFMVAGQVPGVAGAATWIGVLTLSTAAAGTGVFLVLLTRSRPGRRPRRESRRGLTPEQLWYKGARAQVLEIMLRRGIVDENEIDMVSMVEMPLGSWHELDQSGVR